MIVRKAEILAASPEICRLMDVPVDELRSDLFARYPTGAGKGVAPLGAAVYGQFHLGGDTEFHRQIEGFETLRG